MKRNFCLGDQWLYYKIYTGAKTADILLLEKIYPLIQQLIDDKVIDKWFFIRYNDPDSHIRLRLYAESAENILKVIASFHPVFEALLQTDIIWKLQTDTYQREIERYGAATIEATETLFFADSEMILGYLGQQPYFEQQSTALLFSFLAIDQLLQAFGLPVADKLQLSDQLQLAFKKEFSADKLLKKEFDKHYRVLSEEMALCLTGKNLVSLTGLYDLVENRNRQIAQNVEYIKENLQVSLPDYLASHIHMMVNRQFTSRQRQYECLIYDHLHRYFKAQYYKEQH